MEEWLIIQNFFHGLNQRSQDHMDAAAGGAFLSRSLGVFRWPVKPPDPSAVQAQEPKTRVVPSDTVLALLDLAIEFTGELVFSPTRRVSCRCLAAKSAQGYP